MKKRSLTPQPSHETRAVSPTGYHCPQTGWWLADDDVRPRHISRGDVMPAVNGRPTHWTLCGGANVQQALLHLKG